MHRNLDKSLPSCLGVEHREVNRDLVDHGAVRGVR